MASRLPFHELLVIFNHVFKHQSIIKLGEKASENYATLATLASCVGAWLYVLHQSSYNEDIEKQIEKFEQIRRERAKQKQHDASQSTAQPTRHVEQQKQELKLQHHVVLQRSFMDELKPIAMASLGVFFGAYFFGRSAAYRRTLAKEMAALAAEEGRSALPKLVPSQRPAAPVPIVAEKAEIVTKEKPSSGSFRSFGDFNIK